MFVQKRVFVVTATIMAMLGAAVLLERLAAEDANYWLDSDSDTCSEENDTVDCSDGEAGTDKDSITCKSGDHYLNATLDVFAGGGTNTQAEEKIPEDCHKPITCTTETHENTRLNDGPGPKTCLDPAATPCYDCDYTIGDPVPADSDLLGDCAEE